MTKCPDCGKTIGRFQVSGDSENDKTLPVLRCPQSGRKSVPEGNPVRKSSGDLKAWKSKKSKAKVAKRQAREEVGIV